MAAVTLSSTVTSVTGGESTLPWKFTTTLRVNDDGDLTVPEVITVLPVNGELTVDLEPGPVTVTPPSSRDILIEVEPDSDDLAELIAAGVPAAIPAPSLSAAVAAYIQAHPVVSVVAEPYRVFEVGRRGADPTNVALSDEAFADAITELGSSPGIVQAGVGTYRIAGNHELKYPGQRWDFKGVGLTNFDHRGPGVAFKSWDSTVNPNGLVAPGLGGGIIGGCTIDGHLNANDGAVGFVIGDLVKGKIDDLYVYGYTRPGSANVMFQNRYSWLEFGEFNVRSVYGENCFIFEAHPNHPLPVQSSGHTSFSYNKWFLSFGAETKQNGVYVRRGASIIGGQWMMNFNCNPGADNDGSAVKIGMDDDDDCRIDMEINWLGEATIPGAVAHYDMNIGANSRLTGYGALLFHDYSNVPWRAGNAVPFIVNFAGRVNCPSLGHYAVAHAPDFKEIPFVTIGESPRFAARGDDANYVQFLEGDNGNWPVFEVAGPSEVAGLGIVTKHPEWGGDLQWNYEKVATQT